MTMIIAIQLTNKLFYLVFVFLYKIFIYHILEDDGSSQGERDC